MGVDTELLRFQGVLKDKDLQIEKMLAEAKEVADRIAVKQLEDWKEKELETHRKVIIDAAFEQAKVWLAEMEDNRRKGI